MQLMRDWAEFVEDCCTQTDQAANRWWWHLFITRRALRATVERVCAREHRATVDRLAQGYIQFCGIVAQLDWLLGGQPAPL